MMQFADKKTQEEALKLLRQYRTKNGDADGVAEIDAQLVDLGSTEPEAKEVVEKPTRKRPVTK